MSDPLGSASFNVDVIVVGAGPIGLTAACALGHHGVKTRVLKVSNVITLARNGGVQAPTVMRMVPKGLRSARRAVSTTVRMSAAPSAATSRGSRWSSSAGRRTDAAASLNRCWSVRPCRGGRGRPGVDREPVRSWPGGLGSGRSGSAWRGWPRVVDPGSGAWPRASMRQGR